MIPCAQKSSGYILSQVGSYNKLRFGVGSSSSAASLPSVVPGVVSNSAYLESKPVDLKNETSSLSHLDFSLWTYGDLKERKKFAYDLGNNLLKKGGVVIDNAKIHDLLKGYYLTSGNFFNNLTEKEKVDFAFREKIGIRQGFVRAADRNALDDLSKRKEQWYAKDGIQPFPSFYPAFAYQTRQTFNNYNEISKELNDALVYFFDLKGAKKFSIDLNRLTSNAKNNTMFTAFYPGLKPKEIEEYKKANNKIVRQGMHTDIDLYTLIPTGAIVTNKGVDYKNNYSGLCIKEPNGNVDEVFPDSETSKDSLVMINGEYIDWLTTSVKDAYKQSLHFKKTPHFVMGKDENLAFDRLNEPFFVNLNLEERKLPSIPEAGNDLETNSQTSKVPPLYINLFKRNQQYLPKGFNIDQFYKNANYYSERNNLQEYLNDNKASAIWA